MLEVVLPAAQLRRRLGEDRVAAGARQRGDRARPARRPCCAPPGSRRGGAPSAARRATRPAPGPASSRAVGDLGQRPVAATLAREAAWSRSPRPRRDPVRAARSAGRSGAPGPAGGRAPRRRRAPPPSGSGAVPCRRRPPRPARRTSAPRRRTASAGRSSARLRGRAARAGGPRSPRSAARAPRAASATAGWRLAPAVPDVVTHHDRRAGLLRDAEREEARRSARRSRSTRGSPARSTAPGRAAPSAIRATRRRGARRRAPAPRRARRRARCCGWSGPRAGTLTEVDPVARERVLVDLDAEAGTAGAGGGARPSHRALPRGDRVGEEQGRGEAVGQLRRAAPAPRARRPRCRPARRARSTGTRAARARWRSAASHAADLRELHRRGVADRRPPRARPRPCTTLSSAASRVSVRSRSARMSSSVATGCSASSSGPIAASRAAASSTDHTPFASTRMRASSGQRVPHRSHLLDVAVDARLELEGPEPQVRPLTRLRRHRRRLRPPRASRCTAPAGPSTSSSSCTGTPAALPRRSQQRQLDRKPRLRGEPGWARSGRGSSTELGRDLGQGRAAPQRQRRRLAEPHQTFGVQRAPAAARAARAARARSRTAP